MAEGIDIVSTVVLVILILFRLHSREMCMFVENMQYNCRSEGGGHSGEIVQETANCSEGTGTGSGTAANGVLAGRRPS